MPFFGDIELTEKQAKIMLAVENVDRDAFVRLGGATGADLNFEVTRDGAGPLLVACARGDLEFVNLMLSNMTLDIDKTDRNGVNSFFMAAYHGHIKVMRRLMEKGVAMFEKNANGSNVLHIAVKRGNMEVLKELIRIQYPLNEPKVNGITAVGIAAMKGTLEILQMLHENGADINQTSPAGIGPLYLAIKAQQRECVRYLVDEGADLYYSDPIRVDYSPVFVAVKMAQMSSIELMCDAGAKLDGFLDSQGYSPFMFAVKFGLHEVVNYLSLRGCDLNQADPANKTVLMYYLLHTDEILASKPTSVLRLLDMARKLVSRGADINHTSTTSQFG
jgi:ankyrin repeat protein